MAFYIVLERKIEGFDPFVNGKFLARCDEELVAMAGRSGVPELMSYFSPNEEDMAEFLDGDEIPEECREDFKPGQKRASKGGHNYLSQIWSNSTGRSLSLGSLAKMLMEPFGCRQWMTRVLGLAETRKRWLATGTRPS